MTDKNAGRTHLVVPDSTVERLDAFRAREWSTIPPENRRRQVPWNVVILRLLSIEEYTRPTPARVPEKRPKRLL